MTVGLLSFAASFAAFNGGKSQGQSQIPGISNDWPFLNLAKQGSGWQGNDTYNHNSPINPTWLGSDGYPLASALSGTSGVNVAVQLPLQSSFTANVKVLWDVIGAGSSDVTSLQIGLMSSTFVATNVTNGGGGNFSCTGNGTNFFYTFTPSYTNPSFSFVISSLGGTAHLQNLRVVFDDGTRAQLLAQGEIFDPQFLSILRKANFGVYRFKDVLNTDIANTTTWSTRKSQSYVSWTDYEWRAILYAGPTTNSGNDYSITFGSGAPIDKQTMHLRFNADATLVQNQVNGGTLTVSGLPGTPTFNWTSHPLTNGNIVSINTGFQGGTQMLGTSPGTNYYVVNATANTFQVSTTVGGTAITTTSSVAGNLFITRMQTLNLNSMGAIPIRLNSSLPIVDSSFLPKSTFDGTIQAYGTIVFDADLQTWLLSGGSSGAFSVGLNSGIPPEVCLQLCREVGCHPHWSLPPFALDPATDYATSLASLSQTGPSWLIPRFEPSNEVWNTALGFNGAQVARNKGFAHWPTVENYGTNWDNWYGKVLSVMGQGLASVFGLGNLGTKYEVMCAVFTNSGSTTPTDRLAAGAYVAQSAPAQSGYSKVAASGYTSAVAPATYITPTMYNTILELQNAWDYYITNAGNPTAQAANLNNFVDTLNGGAAPFNLAYTAAKYSGFQSWASGSFSVNKMFAYEGGYSPDLNSATSQTGQQWDSPITGASKAGSCVLTLATTDVPLGASGQSGNPARNGMALCILSIGGMTQLNCLRSDDIGNATFTAGSASIAWSSNILIAGQAVVFRPGATVPPNITTGTTYYVIATGLSSSAFQISATSGGSAIVAGGTGTYSASLDSGWPVTGVSGNSVTIGVNSSGFGTYTSGGTAYYLGSTQMVNNFRLATMLFATDLQSLCTTNFNNFTSAGGTFPSQYELAQVSAWACIQPDIWGTQSGEFAAIVAYNAH